MTTTVEEVVTRREFTLREVFHHVDKVTCDAEVKRARRLKDALDKFDSEVKEANDEYIRTINEAYVIYDMRRENWITQIRTRKK